MIDDNALHSMQARSVSFDACSMTVTIDKERHAVDDTIARAVLTVCVRYMRERQVVHSALRYTRTQVRDELSITALSKALKYHEKQLNINMQLEVRALLAI